MRRTALFLTLMLAALAGSAKKYKSFTPGKIWKDNNGVHINAHGGGILVRGGTYYWFGEHKTAGAAGNTARVGVGCYSSKDLYNWKDEGIVLHVAESASGSEIERGCLIERPKVIYNKKTGKYIMWFHLELIGRGYGSARSGVAVADKVTGPYKYVGSVRSNPGIRAVNFPESWGTEEDKYYLRDHLQGQMERDMTLFVDDDGTAYHIYASEENYTLQIAQLTDDYLAHNGTYVRAFIGRQMEAPAMFKRGGKYYLIMSGCTGWNPNAARSAVAESVMGPWTELGNPAVGQNSDLTFYSQCNYVLHVPGTDRYIYMGDRWNAHDAIDGKYVWLPIEFDSNGVPTFRWQSPWRL